jgi:hypothetical protein
VTLQFIGITGIRPVMTEEEAEHSLSIVPHRLRAFARLRDAPSVHGINDPLAAGARVLAHACPGRPSGTGTLRGLCALPQEQRTAGVRPEFVRFPVHALAVDPGQGLAQDARLLTVAGILLLEGRGLPTLAADIAALAMGDVPGPVAPLPQALGQVLSAASSNLPSTG